jgi:hypothetical protein
MRITSVWLGQLMLLACGCHHDLGSVDDGGHDSGRHDAGGREAVVDRALPSLDAHREYSLADHRETCAGKQDGGVCTLVIPVTKDTYVSKADPTVKYGNSTQLWIAPPGNKEKHAYLHFPLDEALSGIDTSRVTEVYLLLCVEGVGDTNEVAVTVRRAKGSWSESTLTWNGAAALTFDSSGSNTPTTKLASSKISGDEQLAALELPKTFPGDYIAFGATAMRLIIATGDSTDVTVYSREQTSSPGFTGKCGNTYQPTMVVKYK